MNDEVLKKVIPYEDECRSDYLARVAKHNMVSIDILKKHLYSSSGVNNKDSCKHVAKFLGLTKDQVTNLTCEKYYNHAFRHNSHILSLESFYKYYVGKGGDGYIYFCPECIKDNKYIRLKWYLKDYKICHKHRCRLIYRCSNCNRPITEGIFKRGNCRCGFKFVESPSIVVNDPIFLNLQSIFYCFFGISCPQPDFNIKQFTLFEIASFVSALDAEYLEDKNNLCGDHVIESYRVIDKILNQWPQSLTDLIDKNSKKVTKYLYSYKIPVWSRIEEFAFIKVVLFDSFRSDLKKFYINEKPLVLTPSRDGMFYLLNGLEYIDLINYREILKDDIIRTDSVEMIAKIFNNYLRLSENLMEIRNDLIPVTDLLFMFIPLGLSTTDILKIIMDNKIKVFFYPFFEYGFSVFRVNKNQSMLYLTAAVLAKQLEIAFTKNSEVASTKSLTQFFDY